jgi:hypothetical protein
MSYFKYRGDMYESHSAGESTISLSRYDSDQSLIVPISSKHLLPATGIQINRYKMEKEQYVASFRPGMEPVETESFEGALGLILSDLETLLRKKNKDYGSSYDKTVEELGETVILVRIMDKFNRMKQLIKSGEGPEVEETIEETLSDLVGYGIIELVRRRRL